MEITVDHFRWDEHLHCTEVSWTVSVMVDKTTSVVHAVKIDKKHDKNFK